MALLVADGFDIYADIADVRSSNWISESSSTAQTFSTSQGRYGGGCLKSNTALTGWYMGGFDLAPGQTIIIGFHYYMENRASNGTTDKLLRGWVRDGSTALFYLENNASGDLKAFNQAGTQVGSTASAALSDASWHWIEVKVVLGTNDSTGSITVKVNDVTKITATSIDTYSSGTLAFIQWLGSGGGWRMDDVIIMDGTGSYMNDFLGETKIETLIPNADGSNTAWTASAGSDYQCVDDGLGVANDDTDYIESSTASQKSDFQFSNLNNNPTAIHAVQVRARAKKTDAGARSLRSFITSSASSENGTTMGLTTNYAWRRNGVHYRDPNGTIAWTGAAVDALKAGVELTT